MDCETAAAYQDAEEGKPKRPRWGQPGSRVTRKTEASVFSAGRRRKIVVTVYPDGVIGLRLLRHKREEFIDAASAYRDAVMWRVAQERAKKKAARKSR